jgi:phage tail-like protein
MATLSASTLRLDPYKNFKFRIRWNGQYVAAVNKMSALKRTTDVVSFREGGDPNTVRLSPGQTKFEAITLERGLTLDTQFEAWARLVWNYGAGLGAEMALQSFRRDISLDFYNEAGQLAIAYNIYRCWPSEYTAMPELDAGANAVAIQSLVLQNEGWARDPGVTPPVEPSFG